MSNSLPTKVEELVVELLSRKVDLAPYEKRHWHSDESAKPEKIIVRAYITGRSLEGPKPYEVACEIKFASATLTPEEADTVHDNVIGAIMDPILDPPLPDFGFLFLSREDDPGEARQDTDKLRTRTVTFPFLAK